MNREEPVEDNRHYHVYNRGNDRDRIFGDESDYIAFIRKMKSLAASLQVDVPVYALMPNHYHMIALQHAGGNLSKMMGALATSAAKRYNLKYRHIGHLFQGPFRYKPVPEKKLWSVACYIHLNPVTAKLVREPEEWEFSNYADYAEGLLPLSKDGAEGDLLQVWEGYAGYAGYVAEVRQMLMSRQNFRILH
ncbi:MAG TPA: transposase [Bacteroidota bacterium]|nr:transposase [Bacteroidota bacterium]